MGTPPPSGAEEIRVAVVQHEPQVAVTVRGRYRVLAVEGGQVLHEGDALVRAPVTVTAAGLRLGEVALPAEAIRIESLKHTVIHVDERRLRGVVEIFRESDRQLLVVNRLDLESYLAGVLRHESSEHWPMEALKAQAIISRTYALYQKLELQRPGVSRLFDVTATVASQVYGGKQSERRRTNRAVQETAGIVLADDGRLFPAYFHATCGGHTEDAAQLWQVELPPLRGRTCPYCRSSPHFAWRREIMQKDLVAKLRAHGAAMDRITAVSVPERDPSGRAVRVRFEGPDGAVEVSGKDLRAWLGPSWLKSLLIEPRMEGYNVIFDGHGWGHGVGLCQWGASEMALQGRTVKEILEFYYPGATLYRLPEHPATAATGDAPAAANRKGETP